ncbi:MAG TPA: EpsI family protein [Burkholderiales bacterium]|nr:EpsI family protein [Burkholderiales bacterium]
MTHYGRMGLFVAGLMTVASVWASLARTNMETAVTAPTLSLDVLIPNEFSGWREQPRHSVRVVNPQTQAALDEAYSQVLERIYSNTKGYQIMLSVAYVPEQRGALKTHEPEFCYVAQGFALENDENSQLVTPAGSIPVRRLLTRKGLRVEPVTYWIMVGDTAVEAWQGKLVELGYTLTGRIPDGLVFRVSSIDLDQQRAYQLHDQFLNQLIMAASPSARLRLSGLDE